MEEFRNKKAKTGNESGQQKGCMNRPSFQKQKGPAPSSASAPAPRNRCEMVRIRRTSELDLHSLKIVWHKEVTGLLHVLSVVEPTQVSVVRARQVVSSVGKRVIS